VPRFSGNRTQSQRMELQLGAFHLEELLILPYEGVLRLGKNLYQHLFVEWLQGCNNRQSSHKFGNHAKLDEIIAGYFGEQLAQLVLALLRIAAKADGLPADAAGDNVFETDKRSTANEQDVGSVKLDVLLLGVLAAALGRHVAHRSFEHLEEGLLNSFAADVAGDADVLAGLGDFVDFVDVDDSPLRRLDVKIAGVKKL